jgi:hypothetical protein
MKSDAPARGQSAAELTSHHPPFGLLNELERPGDVLCNLGPNWYASIMGTGIVAIAGADLPFRVPGLHMFATVVWALAAAALLALTIARAVRWIRYLDRARADASNPVMAQFWGAPAMALMTVGTGTLILGRSLIGSAAAVDADWALWAAGTALGLVTTAWIPYLMFTRYEISPDAAFGGWLMPVVPPMVSAANGALLNPLRRTGPGPADPAAGLLRDVRHQPVRLGGHHPDLVAAGPLQDRPRGHGADPVDRARPARPVHHRGGQPG